MLLTPKDLMEIARHQVKSAGASVDEQTFEVKYRPGQPRVPAGSGAGGQFAGSSGGGVGAGGATAGGTTTPSTAPGTKDPMDSAKTDAQKKAVLAEHLTFSGAYVDFDESGKVKKFNDPTFIQKNDKGNYVIRDEFFYTGGRTSQNHADRVASDLNAGGIKHEIVNHGQIDRPFRGGARVGSSSHWFVEVKLPKKG